MTGIYRKVLIFLTGLLSSFHALAQSPAMQEAVIISKVDTPMAQSVTLTFKKNYFNLLEETYECNIDNNNVFSAKLKLQKPSIVLMRYRDKTMRLYVAPGDTLWMRFNGKEPDKTLSFSGTANAPYHNRYMHQALLRFPDWVNENIVNDLLETKTPDEYHKILDEVYRRKKEFFDNYPEQEKNYFAPEFLDFVNSEIEYWWGYQLLRYFERYGLDNPKADRKLNDLYFDYLLELQYISAKSLHNEQYINFLDLYLKYEQAKRNAGGQKLVEVEEKKATLVRVVKPKDRTVRVFEEPYLTTPPVVTYLSMGEEAIHLQVTTHEKFKYYDADKTFDCVFYKIKTPSGRIGWVPEALVNIEDRTEVQVIKRPRICLDETSYLCGFETLLNGKVLNYVVAKDILFSLPYEKMEVLQGRIDFFNKNNPYPEFAELLKNALEAAKQEPPKTIDKLVISPNCIPLQLGSYNPNYIVYKLDNVQSSLDRNNLAIRQSVAESALTATKLPVQKIELTNARPDEERTQTTRPPQLATEAKTTVIPPAETRTTSSEVKTEAKVTPTNVPTPPSVAIVPPAETRLATSEVKNEPSTEPKVTPTQAPKQEVKQEPKQEPKQEVKSEPAVAVVPPAETRATIATEVKTETRTDPNANSTASTGTTELKSAPAPYFPTMAGDSWETVKIPDNYKPVATQAPQTPQLKGVDIGLETQADAPLMDFEAEMNGNLIKMSDFKNQGKIIVIDFWAVWCTSCITDIEGQYRTNFLEQYKDKNVVFLYISTEKQEEKWKNFLLNKGWTQGVHVWDRASMASMEYGATQLPLKYIITPDGKVAYNSLRQPNVSLVQCLDTLLQESKNKQ